MTIALYLNAALLAGVLLVLVSLVSQPESLARLRGLTFKTLESAYIPSSARSQQLFRVHLLSTVFLVVFVIGLWVYFA